VLSPRPKVRSAGLMALVVISMLAACAPSRPKPSESDLKSSPRGTINASVPAIAFTIQVGAFSSAQRAALLSEKLQTTGLDAYYFIDTDRFYKVRFERFNTKAIARRRAKNLQARGLIEDYYIVSPVAGTRQTGTAETLKTSLVQTAHQFVGTPYRWGGASAETGFDCSGLTMTVYRLNGLNLPRSARSQFRAGRAVSRHSLQQGDLVFFATGRKTRISHVGIFIGGGRFIHAPGRGKRIRTAGLNNSYFKGRYRGARRYF
jgi:hypothetical protein